MNIGVVSFAPGNRACEMTEEVVNLYVKISKDLDFQLRLILYSVLILMIDAHFDDEEKFEELTNMVNDNTSPGVINEFSPFDGFKESLEYANIRISELESKNSELKARIRELENQICE